MHNKLLAEYKRRYLKDKTTVTHSHRLVMTIFRQWHSIHRTAVAEYLKIDMSQHLGKDKLKLF